MSGGIPLWFSRAVIGPTQRGALALVLPSPWQPDRVTLGTVVERRARSSALVCFDDGRRWSEWQARRSSSGAGPRVDGSNAADGDWPFCRIRPSWCVWRWEKCINICLSCVPSLSPFLHSLKERVQAWTRSVYTVAEHLMWAANKVSCRSAGGRNGSV